MKHVLLIQKDDLEKILKEVVSERRKEDAPALLLKEYAKKRKICYQTAYRHAVGGIINAKKLGGKWYVMNE